MGVQDEISRLELEKLPVLNIVRMLLPKNSPERGFLMPYEVKKNA